MLDSMKKRLLICCASAPIAMLSLCSGAWSKELVPFICTPSGVADGTVSVISKGASRSINIGTAADGNSSVGVDFKNLAGEAFRTITFDLVGTCDTINGPFLYVSGTVGNSTVSGVVAVETSAAKPEKNGLIRVTVRPSAYGFRSNFNLQEAVLQLYPGAEANGDVVSNIAVNNSKPAVLFTTETDCPAGTQQP